MKIPRTLTWFFAASGWLAMWATGLPPGPPRFVIAFAYVLTCPGAALLCLIAPLLRWRSRRADPLETVALTLGLSLAVGILVSEIYFLWFRYSLPVTLGTLAGLTTAFALGALLRERVQARRAGRPVGGRAKKPGEEAGRGPRRETTDREAAGREAAGRERRSA
ncbi:DUF1616 domain-containing protein [Microtetraspora sp. NBRC 16547]|uniref:DUF1616 domain-containing protein n=1 Tax=Microtetraspora sp. NBRC 16547 TaxID=3030993 RepID=UPI0024A0F243|nr:DUF1616 domain-containing protein [Microtetraspora sp. NBRC 16547]GLW99714.1 hypothetical protein Misp02_38010 [Microtetraspora sp. NBRC 16547]